MNQQGTFNQSNILEILGGVAGAEGAHQVLFNCLNKTYAFLFKDSVISLFLSSEVLPLENYLVGLEIITTEQKKELLKYKAEAGVEMYELVMQAEVLTAEKLTETYTNLIEDTLAFLFTVSDGEYIIEAGSGDESMVNGALPVGKLADLEIKVNKSLDALNKLGNYQQKYYLSVDESSLKKASEELLIANIIVQFKNEMTLFDICQISLVGISDTLEILVYMLDQNLILKEKPTGTSSSKKEEVVTEKKVPEKPVEEAKKSPEELNTDTPLPAVGNFSGSLEILSLVEVIQTLFSAKRTGVLMLDVENGPGVINLSKGEIVHVTFANSSNKEAFYELIKVKRGEFYFEGGDKNIEKTMEIPTMSLLMEAMRQMDEVSGGSQSFNIDNAFADDEAPKSVRRLKKKSSKLAIFTKLFIVLGLAGGAAYALLVYKPLQEKKAAFAPIIEEVERQIGQKKYDKAVLAWKSFLKINKIEHPDWEDEILESLADVVSRRDNEIQIVFNKVDSFVTNKSFFDAQNLLHSNKFLANDDSNLVKKFEEKISSVTQKQKEVNYLQWKTESSKKISAALDFTNEYKNREALDLLEPIKDFLDKEKEPEITKEFEDVMAVLQEREKNIKNGYSVIDSNQSTIDQKIKANEAIILNSGKESDRGKIAQQSIEKLKGQLDSFKLKVQAAIEKQSDQSTNVLVDLLDKLESEASSFEEISYIQQEKAKIKELETASAQIFAVYSKAKSENDREQEFLSAKKLFTEFPTATCIKNVTLPVQLVGLPEDEVLVNGKKRNVPLNLSLHFKEVLEVQAKRKGCEEIKFSLNADLVKNKIVFLDFIKKQDWSIDSPGDLKVWPKTTKNGESFFIANHFNVELYNIKSGQKIWQRQINNPSKAYVKPNGTKVMIGDDDFWVLKSSIEISDEFISVHSKNAELNVFRIRDGNSMLKHDLDSEGVGKPLLVRMSLLGNRDFVFCCTSNGQILNIAIDDKVVRYEESIGDNDNQIVGIESLNEHFYVVVFEKSVKCFSLSNSKVKWEKPLTFRAESFDKIMGKIYIWHKNVLVELGEELTDFKTINIPDQIGYQNASGDKIMVVSKSGKIYRLENSEDGFVEIPVPFSVSAATCKGDSLFAISEGILYLFDTKRNAVIWKTSDKFLFENLSVIGNRVLAKTKTSFVAFSVSE